MNDDMRLARTSALWVGLIVPLVIIGAATIVMLVWLPELPDPAATHWSGGGGPDGFGPAWTYPAMLVGIGGGIVVGFWLMGRFAHRLPQGSRVSAAQATATWSQTARFLCAVDLGVSGFLSFALLFSVGVQRGLKDAADAPDVTIPVFGGFALLALLTLVGWFLQPRVVPLEPDSPASASPLPLAAGERAIWFGTTTMARTGRIVLGISVLVILATTVVFLAADIPGAWIMGATTVLVGAAVASSMSFHVRISGSGILVRSAFGWPRYAIPATEVADVRTVSVNPFAEFGGWGWRFGLDGRTGIVLRTGEGIEISRRGGKRTLVVTIDDAETAASVLAAAAHAALRRPASGEESS